jgi:hypothetical protein
MKISKSLHCSLANAFLKVKSKVSGANFGNFLMRLAESALEIGIKPPLNGMGLGETGFYIINCGNAADVIRK